jgi:hypothetical protein
VVGIPIYFYAVLSDGTEAGNRAAFFMIGTFMAVWIILYGAVQAAAPRLLKAATRPEAELIGRRPAGRRRLRRARAAGGRGRMSAGPGAGPDRTLVAGFWCSAGSSRSTPRSIPT